MFPITETSSGEFRRLNPSSYCWLLESQEELQWAATNLHSRNTPQPQQSISVAEVVDARLAELHSGAVLTPSVDESGHYILFFHLLTPLSRDRGKRNALLDEASNGRPLLLTVLMPECAFNISELEAAYELIPHDFLEQQYGPDAVGHIIEYHGSIYLSAGATFCLLSQEHPALLIPLASAVITDCENLRIREVITGMREALQRLEVMITEQAFMEELSITPHDIYQRILAIHTEGLDVLKTLTCPEDAPTEGQESRSWYLRQLLSESFDTLITGERMYFDDIWDKINARFMQQSNQDEEEDCCMADDDEELLTERECVLNALSRLLRAMRTGRHRLQLLARAVHSREGE